MVVVEVVVVSDARTGSHSRAALPIPPPAQPPSTKRTNVAGASAAMEAAAVAMQLGARSMWKRTLLEWSVRKREVQQVAATRPPPVRVVDLQRPPPPPEKEDPKADTMSRNSVMLKKYKFRAPQEKYAHHEFEWGKTLGLGTYSKVGSIGLSVTKSLPHCSLAFFPICLPASQCLPAEP